MRIQINHLGYSLLLLFGLSYCSAQSPEKGVYHLSVKPNQLKAWLKPDHIDEPIISAHRGGRFIPNYPENAIETFEHVMSHLPVMIECDVSMTADSVLVLLHDRSLDRTTTGNGPIKEKTYAEIKDLNLVDDFKKVTSFRIPTLEAALAWAKDKVLIELDVKRGVPFEMVIAAIEKADLVNQSIIITYNLRDAQLVNQLNSDVVISVGARNQEELDRLLRTPLPTDNLIAFTGTIMSTEELFANIHQKRMLNIMGTLGNLDKQAQAKGDDAIYRTCTQKGVDVIATDRPVEAATAIGLLPYPKEKETPYYKVTYKKNE